MQKKHPVSINCTLILLVSLLFSVQLHGQYEEAYNPNQGTKKDTFAFGDLNYSMIKFNPLTIISGPIIGSREYRLTYETNIMDAHMINIGASYLDKGGLTGTFFSKGFRNFDNTDGQGFRFVLHYRYLYRKTDIAPTGFYVGPELSYSKINFKLESNENITAIAEHIYFSVKWGYQGRVLRWLYIDLFTGAGVKNNTIIQSYPKGEDPLLRLDEVDVLYDFPWKFNLGFNLGVRF